MKKLIISVILFVFLLSGCAKSEDNKASSEPIVIDESNSETNDETIRYDK